MFDNLSAVKDAVRSCHPVTYFFSILTPPLESWPSVKMASIMEGPLSKWTNVMKGWQYRWFVLDYNAGLLSYYTVRIFLFLIMNKPITTVSGSISYQCIACQNRVLEWGQRPVCQELGLGISAGKKGRRLSATDPLLTNHMHAGGPTNKLNASIFSTSWNSLTITTMCCVLFLVASLQHLSSLYFSFSCPCFAVSKT